MILGTEARVRPVAGVDEGSTDRDRGRFLTTRLYPTAPFDPWQPALSYAVAASESM